MTIHYVDVSHYQTGLSLNGANAVCAKATQGTGYVDPTYTTFQRQAAKLGYPFSAYHWLGTESASAQARHAFDVVGPAVPLMIDDEQNKVVVPHTVEFINNYRQLGGKVTMEYLPKWVWSQSGSPSLTPITNLGLALVSSNYPAIGYTENGAGWLPYGGATPTFWQWTSTANFNGQKVDMNAFKGTIDELKRVWGLSGPEPKPQGVDMTVAALIQDAKGAHYWTDMVSTIRPVSTAGRGEVDEFWMFMGRAGAQYAAEIRCTGFNPSREPYGKPLLEPTYEGLITRGFVDISKTKLSPIPTPPPTGIAVGDTITVKITDVVEP
jgi:hypothetical protein